MCFLDEWNKIKKSGHFQILTKIAYPRLSRNLENLPISKFVFVDYKTGNVSQMIKFDCKHDLHLVFFL